MPASGKMLKNKAQRENRLAGIGDEQGRLPSRVKAPNVMIKCTQCSQEIRETKTNTEAKTHAESRHPTVTFSVCFPGTFDPTVVTVATTATSSEGSKSVAIETSNKAPKKKDLSFLEASLAPVNLQKKFGKK